MNNFIEKFQFLDPYSDKLQLINKLLSYPMINFVSQFFTRTRNYWLFLDFTENCKKIINYYNDQNKISQERYEELDRILIGYELASYDYLNLWNLYIQMYNELKNKRYIDKYSIKNQYLAEDEDFVKSILYKDECYYYVHFLYSYKERYEIIYRKQQKLDAGKNIEHLKRHQQEQLSENELTERYNEMVSFLQHIQKRGKW